MPFLDGRGHRSVYDAVVLGNIPTWSGDAERACFSSADALLATGFGLACGLIGGLVVGAIGEPVSSAGPRQILRNDVVYGLMSGAVWGLATAVGTGLALEPRTGLACGTVGFVSGLVGLSAGITARLVDGFLPRFPTGIAAGFPATRRYLVFLLCSRKPLAHPSDRIPGLGLRRGPSAPCRTGVPLPPSRDPALAR